MPQLTWLGDEQAKRAARGVPYRLLEKVIDGRPRFAKRSVGESK